ncbi:protein phosphatase methylesterase [Stereum hirsutum FP-91666 SS1]|uniref:protein phosphatase methylesterase n=1 Tax=Stereum hirsutum (strain FP-91666) TaxID=721885 RepID=UPI000440B939|nr:protein phosphatase methylesterase [Stereum hirsutum FP-91666 SS1]EIM90705.1 protein phosphatase methylesterase [Stereum hirsutum FP-91666 SS1]
MSDLYRSAIQARASKLPQLPPHFGEDGDEEEEAGDSIGALPTTTMGPPRAKPRRTPNPELTPLSAAEYFSQALQVAVPASKLDVRIYYTPPKVTADETGTVMVCHHGAGFSGLTFACFAKEVTQMSGGECGVLSVDGRRHGKTMPTEGSSDDDLSIDVLVSDFFNLIQAVFPDPAIAPTLLLVGHSMGGAVIVRACPRLLERKYRVGGVAVLDVVEGSAIEALPHMPMILNSRPDSFDSVEDAIDWHVRANQIRNPTSARIHVPSLIIPAPSNPAKLRTHPFTWRTPLGTTGPYWESWFTGLSASFLAARTARLLVLAGTDRLDKELMIGQMQGKFQMVVVPGTGHMLHEDDPPKLAEILVDFWRRNERVVAPGVKKVGEL